MTINGKAKGSKAERLIASKFEVWWRQLEPGSRFVRTPLSGGWHGADVRAGFRASGDIMTTATRFPFVPEIKKREQWSMKTLLRVQASPVWEWWRQCQASAREIQFAEPLLVFTKNREPWRFMMREAISWRIELNWHRFGVSELAWSNEFHQSDVPAMGMFDDLLKLDPRHILGEVIE